MVTLAISMLPSTGMSTGTRASRQDPAQPSSTLLTMPSCVFMIPSFRRVHYLHPFIKEGDSGYAIYTAMVDDL